MAGRRYVRDSRGRFATVGGPKVRGNFNPRNTISVSNAKGDAYVAGDASRNLAVAQQVAARHGATLQPVAFTRDQVRSGTKAYVITDKQGVTHPVVFVNKDSKHWNDPAASARAGRRSGQFSTSSPNGLILHEVGHIKHGTKLGSFAGVDRKLKANKRSSPPSQALARRVSRYAADSPAEFAAEVYAGRRTGRRYDHQVMRAYGAATGRRARSVRSQLRK